jgi:aspartyl-tRNA synthetase
LPEQDLRADRQPEFTQLDMEMAFMDQDAIMALAEQLVATIFKQVAPPPPSPLPRRFPLPV